MNENIKIILLAPNEENICLVERLRYNAYGYNIEEKDIRKTYYAHELREKHMCIFACYYQEELVAACYVSDSFRSLYIEQLFVAKDYQEIGLHLGKTLLEYILGHKQIVEEIFQTKFSWSKLAHSSTKSKTIYEKIGYKEVNQILNIMKKRI